MNFRLIAGGDIIMSSPLTAEVSELRQRIKSADIATANLECVVTARQSASDKFINLSMAPDLFPQCMSIGFDLLSFANNHALDYGTAGLRDTLRIAQEHEVHLVGAGENLAESLDGVIVERGGRRVALMGASSTLPNSSAAAAHTPGIAPLRVNYSFRIDATTLEESPGMAPYVETRPVDADLERLCEAIRLRRQESDLVIVHLHWGVPLGWAAATQSEIADYQRPVAHAIIEAGANLIIGHHPHVVQGVEFYKGAPILYSLGNFIKHKIEAAPDRQGIHPAYNLSTLQGEWNRIGALAEIIWRPDSARPACRFHLLQLDGRGEPSPAASHTAHAVAQRIAAQCAAWGTEMEVEIDGSGACIVFTDKNAGH